MKPGRVLLAFALVVFLGGALLAPWLYWAAQAGAELLPSLRPLAANPFHRFLNRALLGLALLGIWPLMRALQTASFRQLGWVRPTGQWRRLALGFGLGFVSLALVVGLAFLAGARAFRSDLATVPLVSKLLSAALSAGVVAVLEETFFRGAVLGGLRRAGSPRLALLGSSAVYALVHFFQRPAPPDTVHWFSGVLVLGQMCRGFADWSALVPGFFTLTLAGLILGLAFQRTGNLCFSIGLHAGWIFWLKFCGATMILDPQAKGWFWGTSKLIDGGLAMLALAVVLVLVLRTPGLVSASKHAQEVAEQV
jgi:uncharacterized protein